MTVKVTEKNFQQEVTEAKLPVLLEFYAVWCGKCAMMADVVSEFAREQEGRIKVCQTDLDREADLAARFGVEKVPTFVSFYEGKAKGAVVGIVSKDALKQLF